MSKAKAVCSSFQGHFKLSYKKLPTSEIYMKEMRKVPHAYVVGSLMYAMVFTRPNITHAIRFVSRFLSNPRKEPYEGVKWILRYLICTFKVCLCFRSSEPVLDGYTNSNIAGDVDSKKSILGFLMTFIGGVVSWQSKF